MGDWINDVPMFKVAGRSFVMGQAPAPVKATATDHLVADCFGGGGVAEAIHRAWGPLTGRETPASAPYSSRDALAAPGRA